MRAFSAISILTALASFVSASPLAELDITATATFPATNPFAHVVNGERNKMSLEIENKSALNVTLKSAAGSIHDPESGKLLKNTTASTYGVTLIAGAKTVLPYSFYSEHKPREVTLKVWVNYDDGTPTGLHHAVAYDSVVTIVEPPASIFDFQLILASLISLALVAGGGYFVYDNYFPKNRKRKARKAPVAKSEISSPVATAATKSYDADWIPAHNLGKKKLIKKEGVVVSSGDESAPERRRSTRKAATPSK